MHYNYTLKYDIIKCQRCHQCSILCRWDLGDNRVSLPQVQTPLNCLHWQFKGTWWWWSNRVTQNNGVYLPGLHAHTKWTAECNWVWAAVLTLTCKLEQFMPMQSHKSTPSEGERLCHFKTTQEEASCAHFSPVACRPLVDFYCSACTLADSFHTFRALLGVIISQVSWSIDKYAITGI